MVGCEVGKFGHEASGLLRQPSSTNPARPDVATAASRKGDTDMVHRTALVISTCIFVGGCAGLQIHQLNPETMSVLPHTPNGAVYYLPKPYLLVTRLPQKSDAGGGGGAVKKNAAVTKKGAAKNGDHGEDQLQGSPPGGDDTSGGKADSGSTPAPASGGGSDFIAQTADYVLKIIYLPDREHPMSITATAGIGTAKLTPTFQNGWMLTGFTSEADSKASEMVQQVAGLVGSVTKAVAPGGGPPRRSAASGPAHEVLKAGLYEFVYDKAGRMRGLCPVDFLTDDGALIPTTTPTCLMAVYAPQG